MEIGDELSNKCVKQLVSEGLGRLVGTNNKDLYIYTCHEPLHYLRKEIKIKEESTKVIYQLVKRN